MMRTKMARVIAIPLLALSATVLVLAEQAGDRLPSPSDLQTLELAKFAAIERHDKAALDGLLDDGLIGVDANGTVRGKTDYLANPQDAGVLATHVISESLSVRGFGNVALVVGIYEEKGVKAGHPYRQRCRFIDTWGLKKGKWVCIGSTATVVIG
ncbi:MAG TPA: nuclear transport factor 2 family protein [Verrucomicrobiae bacterium]|nr:nuclear transport factor 2 family protein [Verrucomicrobiae bacterium]